VAAAAADAARIGLDLARSGVEVFRVPEALDSPCSRPARRRVATSRSTRQRCRTARAGDLRAPGQASEAGRASGARRGPRQRPRRAPHVAQPNASNGSVRVANLKRRAPRAEASAAGKRAAD